MFIDTNGNLIAICGYTIYFIDGVEEFLGDLFFFPYHIVYPT